MQQGDPNDSRSTNTSRNPLNLNSTITYDGDQIAPVMASTPIQNPPSTVIANNQMLLCAGTAQQQCGEQFPANGRVCYFQGFNPQLPPPPGIFTQVVGASTPVPSDPYPVPVAQQYTAPNYQGQYSATVPEQQPVTFVYPPMVSTQQPFAPPLYTHYMSGVSPTQPSYQAGPVSFSTNTYGQVHPGMVPQVNGGQFFPSSSYPQVPVKSGVFCDPRFSYLPANETCGLVGGQYLTQNQPQRPIQDGFTGHEAAVGGHSMMRSSFVHVGGDVSRREQHYMRKGNSDVSKSEQSYTSTSSSSRHRPQNADPFYKTRMCFSLKYGGFCQYNSSCKFAHSEMELRPKPKEGIKNVRDETKKALANKEKPCFNFITKRNCPLGDRCGYSHNVIFNASKTASAPTAHTGDINLIKEPEITAEAVDDTEELDFAGKKSDVPVSHNGGAERGSVVGSDDDLGTMERLCISLPLKRSELEKGRNSEVKNRPSYRNHFHRGTGCKKPNILNGPHPIIKSKEDNRKYRKPSKE